MQDYTTDHRRSRLLSPFAVPLLPWSDPVAGEHIHEDPERLVEVTRIGDELRLSRDILRGRGKRLYVLKDVAFHTGVVVIDYEKRVVTEYRAIERTTPAAIEALFPAFTVIHKNDGWFTVTMMMSELPGAAPKYGLPLIQAVTNPNWTSVSKAYSRSRSVKGFCAIYAVLMQMWFDALGNADLTDYVHKNAPELFQKIFGQRLDNSEYLGKVVLTALLHNACHVILSNAVPYPTIKQHLAAHGVDSKPFVDAGFSPAESAQDLLYLSESERALFDIDWESLLGTLRRAPTATILANLQ